jgi:hypothetical protein
LERSAAFFAHCLKNLVPDIPNRRFIDIVGIVNRHHQICWRDKGVCLHDAFFSSEAVLIKKEAREPASFNELQHKKLFLAQHLTDSLNQSRIDNTSVNAKEAWPLSSPFIQA